MSTQSAMDLINDRFAIGWWLDDDGTVRLDDAKKGRDPELATTPYVPVRWDGDEPIYAPLRKRLMDHGHPTVVCPRCMQPTWAISRHASERHGDSDVVVLPPPPGRKPPEWFRPEWV